MTFQIYKVHLLNGEVIDVWEDYELPASEGLVGKFEKAKDRDILTFGDMYTGPIYVPKKSILFISCGDVIER